MGERTYLIDTHAVVWLAVGRPLPPSRVRHALEDDGAQWWASAISAYEVALKVRLGKLDPGNLLSDWSLNLTRLGADLLEVSHTHGLVAGSLDWSHRDPFDRLLVAQARVEGLTLVTADRVMQQAPGVDVLAW